MNIANVLVGAFLLVIMGMTLSTMRSFQEVFWQIFLTGMFIFFLVLFVGVIA